MPTLPFAADTPWMQLAIYAVGAAIVLTLLFRIPRIGGLLRGLFSVALLAFGIFIFLQQAPYHPGLSEFTSRMGLDRQEVVGGEERISMSRDGHFWARVKINGVERRMLIDSGATVTALSQQTADLVGVEADAGALPVVIRTANGTVAAKTGSVDSLVFGGIEASHLKVVIGAGLGNIDVLGMNFLSQLSSWRVEGKTLILAPAPPAAASATKS